MCEGDFLKLILVCKVLVLRLRGTRVVEGQGGGNIKFEARIEFEEKIVMKYGCRGERSGGIMERWKGDGREAGIMGWTWLLLGWAGTERERWIRRL